MTELEYHYNYITQSLIDFKKYFILYSDLTHKGKQILTCKLLKTQENKLNWHSDSKMTIIRFKILFAKSEIKF